MIKIINIDSEIFEISKDNNLLLEQAEELQEFKDDTRLDTDDALEVLQDL